MNTKAEQATGSAGLDVVKLVAAALLIAAGVAAYYVLPDGWTPLVRTAVMIAGILAGLAVGAFTLPGRSVREYLHESQIELRKVVWPTRQETIRTTVVIIIVVIILSLLLGLIDLILKWAVIDHLLKLGH
jgi:preprotein translocase subunit SecE